MGELENKIDQEQLLLNSFLDDIVEKEKIIYKNEHLEAGGARMCKLIMI